MTSSPNRAWEVGHRFDTVKHTGIDDCSFS